MKNISRSGRLLGTLFGFFMSVLARTVRVHIHGLEYFTKDKICAYWHGDSCAAILMLNRIRKLKIPVSAIVTSDWRGDSIEKLIRRAGGEALRMQNGYAVRENIRALYEKTDAKDSVIVGAMDGPYGPNRQPKRLLFRAAEQSDREVVQLTFEYGLPIKLKNRWDDYKIPFPFSRLDVTVNVIGAISKEKLRNFGEIEAELTGAIPKTAAVSA